MMNLPGNILRGAGNVVGGTVSALGSVTGVSRNNRQEGEIVLKEKSVLTVKVVISHFNSLYFHIRT
jgi:hypothetical protein